MDNYTRRDLHLCDFDGTLYLGNSLLHFLRLSTTPGHIVGALVQTFFGMLFLALTFRWNRERAKLVLLQSFLGGKTSAQLQETGRLFCEKEVPPRLRAALIGRLREAVQAGHTVAVVSASADLWLRPFCEKEGFTLICTAVEANEGKIFFHTPNCRGEEKSRRIREVFNLNSFAKIYAYGDSSGDDDMLALAHHKVKF